jgi:plastocyanin
MSLVWYFTMKFPLVAIITGLALILTLSFSSGYAEPLTPTPGLITNPPGLITNPPGLITNPPGLITNPPGLITNPPGLITNPAGLVLTSPEGFVIAQLINTTSLLSGQDPLSLIQIQLYQLQQRLQREVQVQQQLQQQQLQQQLQQQQLQQLLELILFRPQLISGLFNDVSSTATTGISSIQNISSNMNNKSSIAQVLEDIQLHLQRLDFQQSRIQQSQQIQQQFLFDLQQSQQIQQQFLLQLQERDRLNVPTIANGTILAQLPDTIEPPSGNVSNATIAPDQQRSPGLITNSSNKNVTTAPSLAPVQDNRQPEKALQANAIKPPSGNVSNATIAPDQQRSPGLITNSSNNKVSAVGTTREQNRTSEIQTASQIRSPQVGRVADVSSKDMRERTIPVDFNATKVQEQKSMALGPNVKNLVILIPNEAHHGPNEERERRLIDQPFVPANALVARGTNVVWYNADVDHEHSLNLSDMNKSSVNLLGDDGDIDYNGMQEFTFNDTGNYRYYDTQEYDEDFQMSGMLNVVDPKALTSDPMEAEIKTVGTFIVPSDELEDYLSKFEESGLGVHDVHHYRDPTGDDKELIIWTSTSLALEGTLEELEDITPDLPYE